MNKGYDVTVFESLHKTGGVLVYGIPQFRLPKEIVAAEVAGLEAKGVKFVTDAIVGRAVTVDELMKEEGFESVFIGTGRRSACVHEYSWRKSSGRVFGQRVPHQNKSHESLSAGV